MKFLGKNIVGVFRWLPSEMSLTLCNLLRVVQHWNVWQYFTAMKNYCCFSCGRVHLAGKTSSFKGKSGCRCLDGVFNCNITFSVFWLSIRNGNENMAHDSLSLSLTFPFLRKEKFLDPEGKSVLTSF